MPSKQDTDSTAIRQREWLLRDIIPSVLEELRQQLEKSSQILSQPTKTDSLALSSTNNESMKGFITLNGPYITKGELHIRLANAQDMPIKTMITASTPYFLEQVQKGTNYITLAAEQIQQAVNPLATYQTAIEHLDIVCQYVDRARMAFNYPNDAELFPYKVCHPKSFSPPLKEDLVIEFCIQDVYIVCNTYSLDFRSGKSANSENQLTYKDKTVHIVDQSRTQTQSPMLTELKSSLWSIRELCQTYRQMLLQTDI